MFRRNVKSIQEVLSQFLRQEGLETPLCQHRLVEAWGNVAGSMVEQYTEEKFIKNQTLYVKVTSPALRQDLSMMRADLVKRLNQKAGAQVIVDIRFY
ncbi:MAG: DUF721 domain-containing protein [Prevotella sp.]|nr:DUF721 domain-containing protein [Prevotella sp.]